jgi:hypothetical protein
MEAKKHIETSVKHLQFESIHYEAIGATDMK